MDRIADMAIYLYEGELLGPNSDHSVETYRN